MSILKWLLVVVAFTYFFTGYWKVANCGLQWAEPDNLALMIHRDCLMHLVEVPATGWLLISSPLLCFVSSVATLVLECGFVVAVLLGAPITLWVLGLYGLHTMILLTMGIFFFDQYLLFLLYVPWDRLTLWARTKLGSYNSRVARQPFLDVCETKL